MDRALSHEDDSPAQAERRLARTVLFGLGAVALVALALPLIGYRNDVAEVHRLFRARVAREAAVYAEALHLHVRALEAELERIAARPQVDLHDNSFEPEQLLLEFTHHNSALFAGVALLDESGLPAFSEPRGALPPGHSLGSRGWFQRVLLSQGAVVDALEPGSPTFVVAVPVLRGGKVTGALVGMVDASKRVLPGGRPVSDNLVLVVLNRAGDVLVPDPAPAWTRAEYFSRRVDGLLALRRGETMTFSDRPEYAAATQVGDTGLRLLLVADEQPAIAPVRARFLTQLLVTMLLQTLTVVLFSWYLGRTYRSVRAVEARAARQEKMAALGSAASLIAHEVKNSLNGLKAAAGLLASGADPALPTRTIRGQVDRLGHLASSLLHFGKPGTARVGDSELTQVVRDAVESLRALPEAEEVRLETELGTPITVRCDPLLLATALDNLIRNAIEATVAAKDLGRQSEPTVRVRADHAAKSARVTVEDNAGGPPADFESHLFQPFVTSKPKGIGLGLSMARQALEQQGGSLHFERTAAGSRFTVQLARPEEEP